MQHKVWWIVNLFFAAAFISGTVLILLRQVDGAGHVETPGSRLAALAVLGVFLLLIVIVELIVWAVIRASRKRN
ncbi:DUF3923 family protein [Schleiferilactobacillus harbinensis]|uniref:DUF3923 family protein n=1 Tax=Schleiferilactobacillus harbinensis TaxID=304207 RepID=UPI0039E75D6D